MYYVVLLMWLYLPNRIKRYTLVTVHALQYNLNAIVINWQVSLILRILKHTQIIRLYSLLLLSLIISFMKFQDPKSITSMIYDRLKSFRINNWLSNNGSELLKNIHINFHLRIIKCINDLLINKYTFRANKINFTLWFLMLYC